MGGWLPPSQERVQPDSEQFPEQFQVGQRVKPSKTLKKEGLTNSGPKKSSGDLHSP
jgi:hypothetical protein